MFWQALYADEDTIVALLEEAVNSSKAEILALRNDAAAGFLNLIDAVRLKPQIYSAGVR